MFKTLKNFIFSINVALVTVLFLIIFSFATYLQHYFHTKRGGKTSQYYF